MEVQFYYISLQGTKIKDRIIEVRIMEVQFYYISSKVQRPQILKIEL